MSGHFTRKMYDGCAAQQDLKQSTNPLELILDVNKYVHCDNICKPAREYPPNGALLVDVESSLWGIDKLASRCDSAKHPFCGPNGCLLTNDARVAPHTTPYACERGHVGENAVITTNMRMPKHPGYTLPNPNICANQNNGYYANPNRQNNQVLTNPTNRQNNQIPQNNQVLVNHGLQNQVVQNRLPQNNITQNPSQNFLAQNQPVLNYPQHRILPNIRNQQVPVINAQNCGNVPIVR
ncbi:hypothetical protein H012_gp572 [Acanthamoeba polyphaga moumouvirus]|uniref:Uncharacterized protein n=2 Tax=Moumouvirus TaxID=3080801 RepID=L7RCD2_9VIRU|nr:hypothetical protein H012_gp572 [Acanthamoeba polyphaga moumouvirus]AEX62877.1 hypothetical protein mv_R672 [Moumouvirus Monve]AGC01891.1 hypothetical protein Moumou_00351 [Acanthamoeba polyphaga moumouvirus]AQN68250.1 hypothetical protein [Saudi moumouvirus]